MVTATSITREAPFLEDFRRRLLQGAFDLTKSDSGITLVKTDNPDRERGVANMRELMNIFEEI